MEGLKSWWDWGQTTESQTVGPEPDLEAVRNILLLHHPLKGKGWGEGHKESWLLGKARWPCTGCEGGRDGVGGHERKGGWLEIN